MPAPSTHYRLGPSSSSRWLACPHSLRSEPRGSSSASREGDEAHHYGAALLAEEIGWSDVPREFHVGLSSYVAHIEANGVKPIVERQWESLEVGPEWTSHLPPQDGLKEGFGGTIDCLLIDGNAATLYDLKWGEIPVKAQNNTQLLSYASIIHEHFDVSSFTGVIVQPNTKKGLSITTTQFSETEVVGFREQVKRAAMSDHKAVGRQCLFCPMRLAKQCHEGMAYAAERNWKFGR